MLKPEKDDRAYVKLAKSEMIVSEVAARIFSAFISMDMINEKNEDDYICRSIEIAIKLAKKADERIRTEGEI